MLPGSNSHNTSNLIQFLSKINGCRIDAGNLWSIFHCLLRCYLCYRFGGNTNRVGINGQREKVSGWPRTRVLHYTYQVHGEGLRWDQMEYSCKTKLRYRFYLVHFTYLSRPMYIQRNVWSIWPFNWCSIQFQYTSPQNFFHSWNIMIYVV